MVVVLQLDKFFYVLIKGSPLSPDCAICSVNDGALQLQAALYDGSMSRCGCCQSCVLEAVRVCVSGVL